MNIGELIKQRRTELELTYEDIGNFVGVGKSTVRKWEKGIIKNMGADKIELLSKILKISPLDFFETAPAQASFTADELRHIEKYRQLDADGQAEIDGIMDLKLKLQNAKSKDIHGKAI